MADKTNIPTDCPQNGFQPVLADLSSGETRGEPDMVRKAKKKAPVRKSAKVTSRKKPAKKRTAKKPAAKKRAARKRVSAIKALENAIEVGIADLDDVAVSMGLLGAVEPPKRRKRRAK